MLNNEKQLLNKIGENLPVVSDDEQVQRNSMRLYIYLISISQFEGRNKPRTFSQRDFTINKIHTTLNMHETTIKKYWKILEDNGLIVYNGSKMDTNDQKAWNTFFMKRRNNKAGFYSIPKKQPYRIIPRETIEKMQKEFLIEEKELKLYLLLANMQEHFCYMKTPERQFTLQDLRELLQVINDKKNNKTILQALQWLKSLKLIDYVIKNKEKNNLGYDTAYFELISVNYYTNGGDAYAILLNNDTKLHPKLKEQILNEQLIDFD